MDFKKILESFDAVDNDTAVKALNVTEYGSMLAILESFNRVENESVEEAVEEVVAEEETIEAAEEETVEETVEESEEELEEELEEAAEEVVAEESEEELEEAIMVSAEGDEAAQLLSILQLAGMPAPAPAPMEPEMEMQDEYSNSPDEVEQDVDAVIASGDDLHREKEQFAAAADGDNPMKAFEGKFKSIMDELLAEEEK